MATAEEARQVFSRHGGRWTHHDTVADIIMQVALALASLALASSGAPLRHHARACAARGGVVLALQCGSARRGGGTKTDGARCTRTEGEPDLVGQHDAGGAAADSTAACASQEEAASRRRA
eukprot:3390711-Rhodomonas_salina.2